VGGSLRKNPESLFTLSKNPTKVEVRINTPALPHHDGAARFRTEPLFPCRRHQLTESTSPEGAMRAHGCILLGCRKRHITNKRG
jgi:hypothetical protein